MAVQVIGLKTHIWNNNIKSFLFLVIYPFFFTIVYAIFLFLLVGVFAIAKEEYGYDILGTTGGAEFVKNAIIHYWYVPHIVILIFLLVVYYSNLNRLDIGANYIPITHKKHKELYQTLENLCISRGLSTPHFFILKDRACNAYTAGLSTHTYKVVVTYGLLRKLNKKEVETVLAHELTHIINGDTRLMFIMSTVTNLLGTLAELFNYKSTHPLIEQNRIIMGRDKNRSGEVLFMIIWSILKLCNMGAIFLQFFTSRKREFIADAGAIELTKDPHSLITALKKIESNFKGTHTKTIKKRSSGLKK